MENRYNILYIDDEESNYGLFRFISKPWDADKLKQIIYEVIQTKNE